MRIIQTNKAYFPHIGGIETVVQQLAEGFVTRHGFESHVVACNDGGPTQHERLKGVALTRTRTLARVSSLPISPSYAWHLMRQHGDVLQIHEPFLLSSLTYLANLRQARKRFKRLAIWWHSDIIRQRIAAPLYTPLLRSILREADAIIVATPKHISSSTMLGDFAAKCHVIPFGVDLARFERTAEMQRRVDAIKAQYRKPIVLFTGRLVYYKGAGYLVEAMRQLPEAQLVVVGKGPLKDDLEAIAAAGPDNVTFLPFLAEPDLVAMYHACDVFALPSVEKSEAFGIVQVEAMACGKPVVTADLPTGVTYVNQDGVTGLVVPTHSASALANALKLLLTNPELHTRLGAQAQARIRSEFTVEHMVDRTVEVYHDLLR